LDRAAALADEIGRVRLQMDVQAALARLCGMQGQDDAAQRHRDRVGAIARQIETSLVSSGLQARWPAAGEPR